MTRALDTFRSVWAIRIYALIGFVLFWQLLGTIATKIEFAPPIPVIQRFIVLWENGTIPINTLITLQTMATGLAIASCIAIPLGLLMARTRYLEYAVDPYITLLYAIPGIVLFPFIIIWLGATFTASYVFVIIGPFFPVLINTLQGVKNVNRSLVETGRVFGFNGISLWRKIVLPGSVPYIITGLRLGVGAAILSALVSELFIAPIGLGNLLNVYANDFDTTSVLSTVLMIMVLGYSITEIVKYFERRARMAVGAIGIR
jgi:ABC-type nitrate/sulfonate/bicarbonate transport system permease component